MKSKKLDQLVLFLIPIGVAVNFVGGQIAILLRLPVYLDCIGTVVVGALCGVWPGILVGVISKSDRQQVIRLPLGAVGGCAPEGERDLLGNPLFWEKADRHGISFHAAPHGNYLFRCRLTDKAE